MSVQCLLVVPTDVCLWWRISKKGKEFDLPGDLLDDVTDESGALAQVTLGARDTGLDNARGGFL